MKTPAVTIFVVCILIVGIFLAIYDYKKHGAHEQRIDISKSEADTLRRARDSGDEQLYKQDYVSAINKYKQALRYSPRDAYIYNNLGTAYYRLGLESMNPPMTEEEFGFGSEIDARYPGGPDPFKKVDETLKKTESGIVTAVVKDEAIEKKIAAYARSLGHYVHTEVEYTEDRGKEFWLTIITGKTKEAFLEAEKEYLTAIEIKSVRGDDGRKYSGYSIASSNLGTLYFRMGRKKDAIAQWRRALQLEPNNAELRELLGKYE